MITQKLPRSLRAGDRFYRFVDGGQRLIITVESVTDGPTVNGIKTKLINGDIRIPSANKVMMVK